MSDNVRVNNRTDKQLDAISKQRKDNDEPNSSKSAVNAEAVAALYKKEVKK